MYDRKLLFDYRQELCQQVRTETDPAALLLVATVCDLIEVASSLILL